MGLVATNREPVGFGTRVGISAGFVDILAFLVQVDGDVNSLGDFGLDGESGALATFAAPKRLSRLAYLVAVTDSQPVCLVPVLGVVVHGASVKMFLEVFDSHDEGAIIHICVSHKLRILTMAGPKWIAVSVITTPFGSTPWVAKLEHSRTV